MQKRTPWGLQGGAGSDLIGGRLQQRRGRGLCCAFCFCFLCCCGSPCCCCFFFFLPAVCPRAKAMGVLSPPQPPRLKLTSEAPAEAFRLIMHLFMHFYFCCKKKSQILSWANTLSVAEMSRDGTVIPSCGFLSFPSDWTSLGVLFRYQGRILFPLLFACKIRQVSSGSVTKRRFPWRDH